MSSAYSRHLQSQCTQFQILAVLKQLLWTRRLASEQVWHCLGVIHRPNPTAQPIHYATGDHDSAQTLRRASDSPAVGQQLTRAPPESAGPWDLPVDQSLCPQLMGGRSRGCPTSQVSRPESGHAWTRMSTGVRVVGVTVGSGYVTTQTQKAPRPA